MEPALALDFIYGGKSVFTIKSLKTESHYTYRVNQNDRNEDMYFVSLLTAPDTFTYIGLLFKPSNKIVKARTSPKMHPGLAALSWYLKHQSSPQVEFYHEGKCAACGRPLTTPKSITLGFGPICARKNAP